MTEQAINALCEKLGTTVEYLVPRSIEFGRYEAMLGLRVSIIIATIGLIMFIVGVILADKCYNFDTLFGLIAMIGGIAFLFAMVFLIINAIEVSKWNAYPEMMAYKYILNAVG